MECYAVIKRKELLKHTKIWMNHRNITLSKRSQTEEEYVLYDFIYIKFFIYLSIYISLHIYIIYTDRKPMKNQWFSRIGVKTDYKRELSRMTEMFYLDCGDRYTSIYIFCQNSSNT